MIANILGIRLPPIGGLTCWLFRIFWGVVISQHMGYSEVGKYIILNIRCQNVQFYTLSRYRFFKNKSSNH